MGIIFDENIIKKYNLSPESDGNKINKKSIKEILEELSEKSKRFDIKSQKYMKTDDVNEKLDIIDINTTVLNKITQRFIDVISYILRKENKISDKKGNISLRRCISEFTNLVEVDIETRTFLKNLTLRNELTHDYFNEETNESKLVEIMINYADSPMKLSEYLYEYCKDNNLLEDEMTMDIK